MKHEIVSDPIFLSPFFYLKNRKVIYMSRNSHFSASRPKSFARVIAAAAGFGCVLAASSAWSLTITLGDQDFTDGQIVNGSIAFNTASAGEVSPFDAFRGSDLVAGSNFSASWTFNYAAGTFSAGSMTFGIYDHDSAAPGNQVSSFTVDGVDFTATLNALFNSHGGSQAEVNLYTVDLASVLADLADGSVTFSLTLQGPVFNNFPGNGAGLDFSRLTLRESQAVPEPATLALFGLGLGSLIMLRRRKA